MTAKKVKSKYSARALKTAAQLLLGNMDTVLTPLSEAFFASESDDDEDTLYESSRTRAESVMGKFEEYLDKIAHPAPPVTHPEIEQAKNSVRAKSQGFSVKKVYKVYRDGDDY